MDICIIAFFLGCLVMGIGLAIAIVSDNVFEKIEKYFSKLFKVK